VIEKLTNNWDRDNKNRIDRNFAILGRLELDIMEDFFNADPSVLSTKINGLSKPAGFDLRNLNNYGINFTANVNGIIHRAWVYAESNGEIGFGLAEQNRNDVHTSIIRYITVNLKSGWNEVTLNFPVEQNISYTIFRRNVNDGIRLNTKSVSGWSDYPFVSNGLTFRAGKFLDEAATYANYGPFFDIELVTSLSQVYKIANDSVKPTPYIYVGDNPPLEAQFWFKPVGES